MWLSSRGTIRPSDEQLPTQRPLSDFGAVPRPLVPVTRAAFGFVFSVGSNLPLLGSSTWPVFAPWLSVAHSSQTTSVSFSVTSACLVEQLGISLFASSLSNCQGELEGDDMVVDCDLELGNISFSSYCLMDSGATGFALIDKGFALKHKLTLTQPQNPRTLEVIDWRPISSRHITQLTTTLLNINGH